MPDSLAHKTVIEGLSHTFLAKKGALEVIGQFSLTLEEGETIAILGPSGSGKSTLLRCIAGLLSPTSGRIRIAELTPDVASRNKKIGFAFQEAALLEWSDITDNVMLPAIVGSTTADRQETLQKVQELISLVGLTGFEHYYPAQLSGGMKQRVSLARSLLLDPYLLLLDEPFGSLDLLTRTELILEFSRILAAKKTPTIMVTHSIEEAVFLADRILILSPRPCRVIAEILPELGARSMATFDSINFARKVSECRNLLMNQWKGNESQAVH